MRAVVRADLDGIVSAALLKAMALIEDVAFAKIGDIKSGRFRITDQDIVCNLPYHPDAYMWFDHHSSEGHMDPPIPDDYRGAYNLAPSAAGVIYQHFILIRKELVRFEKLIQDTDLVDSADLTVDEIMNPQGNMLLGLLADARTGFRKQAEHEADYNRWLKLLPDLICNSTTDQIIELESTQKWIDIYRASENIARNIIEQHAQLDDNVIVADFRDLEMPPISRFAIYNLPNLRTGNISVIISDGQPGSANISVGHSIFTRTSMIDAGVICSNYGGGGHRTSAACRPTEAAANQVFSEIIAACKEPQSA